MATKKTKRIAKDQSKQPRAKTEADRIYNARRRAKRAIANLQKQIAQGKLLSQEIEKAQTRISLIQKEIKNSYATRVGKEVKYSEDIESIKQRLNFASYQRTVSESEIKRKNEIWKRNINQATKRGGVSPITEQEAKTFFRATERFWNVKGVTMAGRYEAILKGLGVDTIEEAYRLVINNKYVQEALKELESGINDEPQDFGSPDAAIRLVNKISKVFSMHGNPFTYENLITNAEA